jgi:hypothetical protein
LPTRAIYTFVIATYNYDLCFASTVVVLNGKAIITCSLADEALERGAARGIGCCGVVPNGLIGFVSWTSQVISRGRLRAAISNPVAHLRRLNVPRVMIN